MKKRFLRALAWSITLLLVTAVGIQFWYHHRPRPGDESRILFEGITYKRAVWSKPRPVVIHVVMIDLRAPGIGFLVTPGDPSKPRPLRARTTSQFLKEFHAQVAINGDFFYPWRSNHIWDYYPHVGDAVEVQGLAASRGIPYSTNSAKRIWTTLFISEDNRARFNKPVGKVYNAISGGSFLIRNGKVNPVPEQLRGELNPRTAIALDRESRRLILVAVDGRQPNYSEGVTYDELSKIMLRSGGWNGTNLDGGGSTTLVIEGSSGPEVLNCPIDNRVPGRERPVANHLGVFVRLKAAPTR